MRHRANVILISVGISLLLASISMASYPGGSWLDRKAQTHDLLRNFLCDVLGPVAINGEPNPIGSLTMSLAMVIFVLGLTLVWWSIPGVFSRAIRGCGTLSVFGLIAIALTPPTVAYQFHALALFSGLIPALVAWVLTLKVLARNGTALWLAWLGGFALVSVLIGFGLYAHQYFFRSPPTLALPVSNRVASILFVAWLLAIAVHLKSAAQFHQAQVVTG